MDKDVRNAETDENSSASQFKFTSAIKDIQNAVSFGKKIYSNRAVIFRRLNVVSLILGVISTLIYVSYVIFSGLAGKLSLGFGIVSAALVAAYAAVVIGCIVVAACSDNAKTKNIKRVNKFLKILRYVAKLLSLAISIACLVLGITSGSKGAAAIALDTVMIIIAIIMTVLQTILLLSGGIGGLLKWLFSPVKRKVRFSAVALEWYRLAADDEKSKNKSVRVEKKYIDEAGAVLDGVLLPALGKKYIAAVAPEDLVKALEGVSDELLPVCEGTLKSVFSYARGCGYISENPCDKLNFSGDISKQSVVKKAISGAMSFFGRNRAAND